MYFYQQAGFPSTYYRQPVHRMYMQYQQPYRAAAQRRSAAVPSSGISAYVSGNQVAASGSFLKGLVKSVLAKKLAPLYQRLFKKNVFVTTSSFDSPPSDDEQETFADEIPQGAVENDDVAVSIAEAYPPPAADEEAEAEEPQQDEIDLPVAADVPVAPPAPIAPVYKKKNKVTVQLDTSAAADDEEEQDVAIQHDEIPVYNKARRPAAGKAPSNPINTYFPINFGNTNGGAIAVANAYSTGQKGGARSHAIAYGSPAASSKKGTKRRQSTAAAVSE